MTDKARVTTSIRLPLEVYEWLQVQDAGINATIVEAVKRMMVEEQSKDYRRGFMDGYAKGKNEKKD